MQYNKAISTKSMFLSKPAVNATSNKTFCQFLFMPCWVAPPTVKSHWAKILLNITDFLFIMLHSNFAFSLDQIHKKLLVTAGYTALV